MTLWSISSLAQNIVYISFAPSVNLSCMWGLRLSHVHEIPMHIKLNLIFLCQSIPRWFHYSIRQKRTRGRKRELFRFPTIPSVTFFVEIILKRESIIWGGGLIDFMKLNLSHTFRKKIHKITNVLKIMKKIQFFF